jgi:small subunit ribosomal protein S9
MAEKKSEKYIEAIGRRKTSTARVRITPGSKTTFKINDRDLATYFPTAELQRVVNEAIEKSKSGAFTVTVVVKGGGIHSQAEALRHGMARALIKHDQQLRDTLKPLGMLKRDPRMKERRKFGLKKARKSPQWSKR